MTFSTLLKRAAMLVPPIHRLITQRDYLLQRLAEVNAQPTQPVYNADFLAVWNKSTDFLDDPRFVSAYQAGVRSGHKIGPNQGADPDLHIEWRVFVGCWAGWHSAHLDGDFVECGVNTGVMSLAVCNYIDFNTTGKNFYLFDTFRGIPDDQISAEERALNRASENSMYEECFDLAKRNFAPFPRAHLVRGKVPDTLDSVAIARVCYLHLDMNIAKPEYEAITYFWDKLVPGAIVLLDDYGWAGYINQKKALDAFAKSKGVKILTIPTGQGLLLKP